MGDRMKLKYFSWLPAVFIMVIIFLFSAEPAIESEESSISIANRIMNVYEKITEKQIQEDVRFERLSVIDHIIRKGAHFTEYAILAIVIGFHFGVWKKKGLTLILLSVGISALYAATDEFHQLFVPGRSGRINDVMIDTFGAIMGSLLLYSILNIITKKKKIG